MEPPRGSLVIIVLCPSDRDKISFRRARARTGGVVNFAHTYVCGFSPRRPVQIAPHAASLYFCLCLNLASRDRACVVHTSGRFWSRGFEVKGSATQDLVPRRRLQQSNNLPLCCLWQHMTPEAATPVSTTMWVASVISALPSFLFG